GKTPSIAEFLRASEPGSHALLLRQLIAVDIDYRRRHGESSDPDRYAELGAQAIEIAVQEISRPDPDEIELASSQVGQLDVTIDTGEDLPTRDQSFIDSVRASDGSTVPPTIKDLPDPADHPKQIGRYHVIQSLSSGGQGHVYRALHPNMPLEVAIKVSVNTADEATHRALMAESQILCDLQHPSIARILDVDFDDDQHPFVVLEFVRGLSLQQKLQSEKIDRDEAVALMATLAEALEYAHQRGVLHLDLKPGNLVFNEHGAPKIIDFGLARLKNAWTEPKVDDSRISGTPAYMPPEQAAGRIDELDRRCDQFSLAAIFYQLMTGKKLYDGTLVEQVRLAQKAEFATDLLERSGVPVAVSHVCLKALSKNPNERYGSVTEFAAALGQANASSASSTPAADATGDGKKALRVGLKIAAVVVPAFVLVMLMAIVLPYGSEPKTPDVPSTAEVPVAIESETLAEPIASLPLQLQVNVTHKGLDANGQVDVDGALMQFGAPRENDFVRWDVLATRPGCFRLFALNPDGQIQVAYPLPSTGIDSNNAVDELDTEFHFPEAKSSGWQLTDGVGQQAFVLLASPDPLPPGELLIERLGLRQWDPANESGAWVWKDGELQTLQRSFTRGGVVPLPGKASFESICQRIASQFPEADLHAVSFPVRNSLVNR
ncbi:MAG: serine/threonine-protein kinase, partial [Planctomycetota bacterium]